VIRETFLLTLALWSAGCITSRAVAPLPSSRLRTSSEGGKVTVRVKRAHLKWGRATPDQLVIEIKNRSKKTVRLAPKRLRLVELRARARAGEEVERGSTDPKVPLVSPAEGAVRGAAAGAQLGGSLSGGSGGGGGALVGGLGGMFVGAAVVGVVMIPVGVYILADRLAREAERDIDPGETKTLRVSLGKAKLDNGRRYALDVYPALSPGPAGLWPMPVVDVEDRHLGYGPPSSLRWIWHLRIGGGAIYEGPTTGGLGGVEAFFGRQWRRFSVGAFTMLGLGSAGLETRYRLSVFRWLNLVPFAGYGYTFGAGRFGAAVGHGPRAGLEIDFPLARVGRMGYRRSRMNIGLYGHAGPIFIHDREGVGLKMQFGMVVGVF
jgi:hypothetical protein